MEKEERKKENSAINSFWGTKTGFTLAIIFSICGFYVMGTYLFGGNIWKILTVVTGTAGIFIIGFLRQKQQKKEQKLEEEKTRNATKGEITVTVNNGCWACPSCGLKMIEPYDTCSECGQPVTKK